MYDCEGAVSNDPKLNGIYKKYVQEQMIRALDNATEYQAIADTLKAGKPLPVANWFTIPTGWP